MLLALSYSRDIDFPASWHPDELSKAAQLQGEPGNFFHPRLLLEATRVARFWASDRHTSGDVVRVGRLVSACAAAIAVGLLAWLAGMLGGRLTGLLAALLTGTNPLLFGIAHYMKEDAIYILGIAAFFLALAWYDRRATRARLLALAATAGLAMSGKYIGVVFPLLMLGVVAWRYRGDRRELVTQCFLAGGVASVCFLTINVAMIAELGAASMGMRQELSHVLSNHEGFVRPMTSPFYLQGLFQLCGAILLAAYLAWIIKLARQADRPSVASVVLAAFPVLYLAVLQVSPVKTIRYELPAALIIATVAALGLARLLRRSDHARPVAAFALGLALLFNLHGVAQCHRAIVEDTRERMAEWIRRNLPADAMIVQNRIVGLSRDTGDASAPNTIHARVATLDVNTGSLRDVHAVGATHVLIADQDLGRYFSDNLIDDRDDPVKSTRRDRRRAFYREVFARGILLHRIEGIAPIGTFFSPGLWLFDISDQPSATSTARGSSIPRYNLLQD